jgi:hypothetical protein
MQVLDLTAADTTRNPQNTLCQCNSLETNIIPQKLGADEDVESELEKKGPGSQGVKNFLQGATWNKLRQQDLPELQAGPDR